MVMQGGRENADEPAGRMSERYRDRLQNFHLLDFVVVTTMSS